ncbi:tRNA pseudouridine(38-40) synthase TruA [Micropruina sonneratiae]|uniref:tRNA pseudouridine(38-40) synthase TruA n=1 Tax=Micropruina sonneratiae TaxID=2986940 RepID=UPI0022264EAE|nr:tRNA pseudouridine(38-40) synthase TruA [Micropruina sp. KQZ13P-5]MCW3156910.1 tRNA pseudouridine(38-40) synthase TruA [Micropruina sp. KQZ13P-5]
MRLRLDIAYDGTEFHGWAGQRGLRTVQEELEAWIPRVLRLTEPVTLTCAGRTDAGVHARGQVAHVDIPDPADPDRMVADLSYKLRNVLPPDVVVRRVGIAPPGFDARFSAIWRRYVYRIADSVPDPLLRIHTTVLRAELDLQRINAVAPRLLGLHDFAAFCKQREGATTIRNLLQLSARRAWNDVAEITVLADAFCHSMVRSLVGALVAVATGRREPDWLVGLLDAGQRAAEVRVMPAGGLTLEEVGYPPDRELAARALAARAVRSLETSQ